MATVEAVYEQGVLKLKEPMDLADGTTVEVTVVPRSSPNGDGDAAPYDPRELARRLAEIDAMAGPHDGPKTSVARDHDKFLYGEPMP